MPFSRYEPCVDSPPARHYFRAELLGLILDRRAARDLPLFTPTANAIVDPALFEPLCRAIAMLDVVPLQKRHKEVEQMLRRTWIGLAAAAALMAGSTGATKEASSEGASQRDGQRDFDFLVGSWKIHLKKLVKPLSGSSEWVEFDGTTVCRSIWGGRAELEEFNVDSPAKKIHIQGLALRLYNEKTHQWRIYWANATNGAFETIPVVGQFTNGRGEFYDQEDYQGRAILTRFAWTNTASKSPHFEQSFSTDGGKTWETNWITEQTKDPGMVDAPPAKNQPVAVEATGRDGQRDFDFEIGKWKLHSKRLTKSLAGSTTWYEFDCTSEGRKVWGGNADMEEMECETPKGHLEGLTIRLYNTKTQLWRIYWANASEGMMDTDPVVGVFKDGVGEFHGRDFFDDRPILVRYRWSKIAPRSASWEQAFSADWGKTWETNWMNSLTRY